MEWHFDWTGLTPGDLKEANTSKEEDYIVASIPVSIKEAESEEEFFFIVDVHHENYRGEGRRFDLEVYTSDEYGLHKTWLDSIKSIKTATSYTRFCRRAESAIMDYLFARLK